MPPSPPEDAPGEGFKVQDRRGQRAEPEPVRPAGPTPSTGPRDRPPGPSDLPPGPDLTALILLLANSAVVHLGEEPEPMGGTAPADLAQAKFSIDLLGVLKEKTEGKRSSDESQLLDGILYDLQMRFVRAMRAP